MIMNLAFTDHQFTDKAKNTKTTMFKTFSHKNIHISLFQYQNFFIPILCFPTFKKLCNIRLFHRYIMMTLQKVYTFKKIIRFT